MTKNMVKKVVNLKQPKSLMIPMSGYTLANGSVILEFRKKLIVCEENKDFITALIKAALSKKPVKAEVQFYFKDNLRAYAQLKKVGLIEKSNPEEKNTSPSEPD